MVHICNFLSSVRNINLPIIIFTALFIFMTSNNLPFPCKLR